MLASWPSCCAAIYLKPVYHGETGVRTLRELARSYLTITKDLTRVMSRLKALYRSWAIPCAGRDVYYTRHRAAVVGQDSASRECAAAPNNSTNNWTSCNSCASRCGRELLAESRKHPITSKLRQIPCIGPIRAALLMALMQTPHRFRTKRQLWAYSGLALETRISAEYRYVEGQLRRSKKLLSIRGPEQRPQPRSERSVQSVPPSRASVRPGPLQDFYQACLDKGMKPTMARLTLARKIAAITLTLWKKGEGFDAEKLKPQAA